MQHDRGLPVALAAEAVPVGHQPLDGQAGQLAQSAEVLEVGGEGPEAALGEERPQAGLDPGAVAQRLVPVPARRQFRRDVVEIAVRLHQVVDLGVADLVHHGDQVVHAVGVDRDPEPQLGLDLVALGDRDVAHVVPEPGQLEPAYGGGAQRGPLPGRDPPTDHRVADVADHGLARHPEPGLDVAELPVAVGGLVQVHEVHVDGRTTAG